MLNRLHSPSRSLIDFFSSYHYHCFCSLPPCLSHSFSTLFLVLGATWQAGSVTGCRWYNKPRPLQERHITYLTPSLVGDKWKETGWVLRELGDLCPLNISGGEADTIHLSPGVFPPCSSSYCLIEPWHWCCLSIWLSLSVTSHCSCFPGFANSGTSGWYMKPRLASTTSPEGTLFHPSKIILGRENAEHLRQFTGAEF